MARDALVVAGHDVVHAGDWPEDPGDEEILARAFREGRVLVTLDKDFGELTIIRAQPHLGIVRLVEIPAQRQGTVCAEVLERYGPILGTGAIVTVERGRTRVRAPQTEDEPEKPSPA
jgi:predicted nuclease of predicted toxin-antitoxin system